MTAQILESHGVTDTTPGGFALLPVDRLMLNDVSGAVALDVFEEMGATRVYDPAKISCVADHFWPAKDAVSAAQIARLRTFASDQGIGDYFEGGATVDAGIEHRLLAELGRVTPGSVVVGGDSHTCTTGAFGAFATGVGATDIASVLALGELWIKVPEVHLVDYVGTPGGYVAGKDLILAYLAVQGVGGGSYAALEFDGPAVRAATMDDRMALCNMAVEGGAKTGIVPADATTLTWLEGRDTAGPVAELAPLAGATYDKVVPIDLEGMGPLVAMPFSPGNVVPVADVPRGIHVDQVYVGNCSNGSLSDLKQLASILKGHQVAKGTRLIVVPASQRVYRNALVEGVIETLIDAGAMVSAPTCGACFGGHGGILAAGEVAVTTTNRNFTGRMGDPTSQVYLANAYVAAAAAVTGELVDPADVAGAQAVLA